MEEPTPFGAGAAPQQIRESDLALAAAVLRKDRKATGEFVQRYADDIWAYVWRRVRPDHQAAEDLVQDVFLAAWLSLANYRGTAPLRGWLLGIARHKVRDFYRSRLRQDESLDDGYSAEIEIEASGIDRERLPERTERVLERMREDYRLLLRWRYWDHKSALEMAESTGRSVKAVERMLARAREQFASIWQEDHEE